MNKTNLDFLLKLNELNFLASSDHHFGHRKVFEKYEPIRQTLHHDFNIFENSLIVNWNSIVKNNEIVLYLGDFAINKRNPRTLEKLIKWLNRIVRSEHPIVELESIIKDTNDDRLFPFQGMSENVLINSIYEFIDEHDGFKTKLEIEKVIDELNGNKILIKGNHDTYRDEYYLNNGWDFVVNDAYIVGTDSVIVEERPEHVRFGGALVLNINGSNILFSHFNIFSDNGFDNTSEQYKYSNEVRWLRSIYEKYECILNIHGHTHSMLIDDSRLINVCVENNGFQPKKILEIIKEK